MRIGLFFKYDREVVNGSENREIPDLWGRVDRYGQFPWSSVPEWVSNLVPLALQSDVLSTVLCGPVGTYACAMCEAVHYQSFQGHNS